MAKSTAAIPSLDEECSAIQYAAWVARLERWQAACRITDKAMENRILESIPNSVADQIVVSLVGNEDKAGLMEKITEVMVKKNVPPYYTATISISSNKAAANSLSVSLPALGSLLRLVNL